MLCSCSAHLLTLLLSGRRRSRPPSGCTLPWGTAGHRPDSVASPAELQQPLRSRRAQERVPVDLLVPSRTGPGLGARRSGWVPVVLPRARLVGERQVVPWGRAGGPGHTGATAWGMAGGDAGLLGPGEQETRWPGCGEEKERGTVRFGVTPRAPQASSGGESLSFFGAASYSHPSQALAMSPSPAALSPSLPPPGRALRCHKLPVGSVLPQPQWVLTDPAPHPLGCWRRRQLVSFLTTISSRHGGGCHPGNVILVMNSTTLSHPHTTRARVAARMARSTNHISCWCSQCLWLGLGRLQHSSGSPQDKPKHRLDRTRTAHAACQVPSHFSRIYTQQK